MFLDFIISVMFCKFPGALFTSWQRMPQLNLNLLPEFQNVILNFIETLFFLEVIS